MHCQLKQRAHPFLNYNFSVLLKRSFIALRILQFNKCPQLLQFVPTKNWESFVQINYFFDKKLSTSYSQFTKIEWLNIM